MTETPPKKTNPRRIDGEISKRSIIRNYSIVSYTRLGRVP